MIKKILATLMLLTACTAALWSQDSDTLARKIPAELIESPDNPILLVFTASWCAPCHRMMSTIFPADEVRPLLKKYNVILLDVDKPVGASIQRELCDENAVPYYIILDKEQNVIASQKGASDSPVAFAAFLKKSIPLEKVADALPKEKFDAIVSADYKVALEAGGEALKPRWKVGVGAGAGICNLTNYKGDDFDNSKAGFDYLVAIYGRLVSLRGTSFQLALQYEPLTGIGIPLELSFLAGSSINLGFGVAPSFILKKGDHRPNDLTLKNFDLAGRLNASYRLNSLRIGITYNYGLVNQRKESSLLEKGIHNRYIQLTLYYDIF